ncbi:topoisomerase II [Paenibacillus thiaminolyticus]|uniref:topoisomerase II n=1 Tax=Paenibacillus thiaminolyticus TaxID=49283 RepID=UPI002542C62A|nr:topoisomerase II [Paenibacillus thiaminolyticus]WII36276.1 topoisomerase II [Paenibacillus thiaminolyticus]
MSVNPSMRIVCSGEHVSMGRTRTFFMIILIWARGHEMSFGSPASRGAGEPLQLTVIPDRSVTVREVYGFQAVSGADQVTVPLGAWEADGFRLVVLKCDKEDGGDSSGMQLVAQCELSLPAGDLMLDRQGVFLSLDDLPQVDEEADQLAARREQWFRALPEFNFILEPLRKGNPASAYWTIQRQLDEIVLEAVQAHDELRDLYLEMYEHISQVVESSLHS